MIKKNNTYEDFFNDFRIHKKKIIIYGAGMIANVIFPFFVRKYKLHDYVECMIDIHISKTQKEICIDGVNYRLENREFLSKVNENYVLIITNTHYQPIVDDLDTMENLKNVDLYILPLMQLAKLSKTVPIIPNNNLDAIRIPKVIHYFWFGNKKKPDLVKHCISSWKRFCSEYTIIEWNENNFDVNKYLYTKQSFELKKYSFTTDLARLDILYNYGGIYLDTDVELIKPLDSLLYQSGFIGTEKWGNINSGGGCGFIKNHPTIKELLNTRINIPFIIDDFEINFSTNALYESLFFMDKGYIPNQEIQKIVDITIYSYDFFHPYDFLTNQVRTTENTYGIHHFNGSWLNKEERLGRSKTQKSYKKNYINIDNIY